MNRFFILLAAGLISVAVLANSIDPIHFDNPIDEKRYQALITDIRCPTCQNQSISDSNALIAGDLRQAVARHIRDGRSDQEIVMFMRERYGDFIYYEPPMTGMTLALWIAPFVMIVFGFFVFRARINRKPSSELDEEQLAVLESELLQSKEAELEQIANAQIENKTEQTQHKDNS